MPARGVEEKERGERAVHDEAAIALPPGDVRVVVVDAVGVVRECRELEECGGGGKEGLRPIGGRDAALRGGGGGLWAGVDDHLLLLYALVAILQHGMVHGDEDEAAAPSPLLVHAADFRPQFGWRTKPDGAERTKLSTGPHPPGQVHFRHERAPFFMPIGPETRGTEGFVEVEPVPPQGERVVLANAGGIPVEETEHGLAGPG